MTTTNKTETVAELLDRIARAAGKFERDAKAIARGPRDLNRYRVELVRTAADSTDESMSTPAATLADARRLANTPLARSREMVVIWKGEEIVELWRAGRRTEGR